MPLLADELSPGAGVLERCKPLINVACRGLLVHFGKCDVNSSRADCNRMGGNGPLVVGAFDMISDRNWLSPSPAPVTLTPPLSAKDVNNCSADRSAGWNADKSAFAERKGAAKAVLIEVELCIHSRAQEQARSKTFLFRMAHLGTTAFLPSKPDAVSGIADPQ